MKKAVVLLASIAVYVFFATKPSEEARLEMSLAKNSVQSSAFRLPIAQAHIGQFVESYKSPDFLPIKYTDVKDPVILAKSFIIQDLGLSKTLLAKNEELVLPIASLTKLMTAVIAIEKVSLEQIYDLLVKTLTESSNEAAHELILKTDAKDFVFLMNEKAKELEMQDTNFKNPTGLDEAGHYSSAKDLSRLADYISKNHPVIWEISRIKENNTNVLLQHKTLQKFIIGGKTGFTDAAMGTLLIVLKTPEPDKEVAIVLLSSSDRFKEMEKLINWVLQAFKWKT